MGSIGEQSTVKNTLDFYNRLSKKKMAPLWEVLSDLVTPEPASICVPTLWQYRDIRPLIMEAGSFITAKEAERRVLILENPGLLGQSRITRSLYAGLQLILPNELAPSHRHTQSALRFVIEGKGAYTTVGGERTNMLPGDFIITPQWSWHEHGNDSDEPMVWLDGLDIPIVQLFEASFAEVGSNQHQIPSRPAGDSLARFGSGLLPVDHPKKAMTSPVFNYPYERTREALENMRKLNEWDPCHGLKMKYINPVTGEYAMPTIAVFMQLLPQGFKTNNYRSTDGTVYVCVEGNGRTVAGDRTFVWERHDTFVIPSWHKHFHETEETDAVLFSFSDRALQEKIGLWREDRFED